MKKRIGIIYGRKSRENATTLEGQINACLEWAKSNNIEIVEIYTEEGSASSEDWDGRPELQKMMKRIENHEYHFVIVSEQTRISRTEDFSIFKKAMRETNTIFVTADTNEIMDYSNPNDAVRSGINQVFGEYELQVAKIRLKRGTVQSAKKGNWQGKKAPIGYEYDHASKRLKKTKDAIIIRKMFDLYLQGFSSTDISMIFAKENIIAFHKVKGEMIPITWSKSTISRSLQNIAYVGHTLYGKTKLKKIKGKKEQIPTDQDQQVFVENTHDPIVTEEEWKQVQKLISSKRMQPPALKHAKHAFSGLIACANCGKHHTFEKHLNVWRISSCPTRHYNDDFTEYKMCGNSGCKLELIENAFYKTLEEVKKDLDHEMILKNKSTNADADAAKKEEKISALEKQKQQYINKAKRLQRMIEDGDYEEDPKEENEKRKEVKQLKQQAKILNEEIEKAKIDQGDSETIQAEKILKKIKAFLSGKTSNRSEKETNDILSDFIKSIVYEKAGRSADPKIKIFLKE